MMYKDEVKCCPSEIVEARRESLGELCKNAASVSADALILAQRVEGYLFGPGEDQNCASPEANCLRDEIQLHYGVCVDIVNTLRRIVEQLEG